MKSTESEKSNGIGVGGSALAPPELASASDVGRHSRACCRLVDVRAATLTLAALETVAVSVVLILVAFSYAKVSEDSAEMAPQKVVLHVMLEPIADLIGTVIGAAVGYVSIALLIVGVLKRRSRLLIPHLIAQALAAIALLIVVVWYSVDGVYAGLASKTNGVNTRDHSTRLIFDVVVLEAFLIGLLIDIYTIVLVRRCFRFLRSTSPVV